MDEAGEAELSAEVEEGGGGDEARVRRCARRLGHVMASPGC